MKSGRIHWRQLKEYIPVKGWWKELHPLDVKSVIIETLKSVPSSLRDLGPPQEIHNTEGPVMTTMGLWLTNRRRSPLK
jgi:hypothetical protein